MTYETFDLLLQAGSATRHKGCKAGIARLEAYMWTIENTRLDTWSERDRSSVVLYKGAVDTGNDEVIAEWWDNAVGEMFEDGFFERDLPRKPRLHQSVVDYCNDMGIGIAPVLID